MAARAPRKRRAHDDSSDSDGPGRRKVARRGLAAGPSSSEGSFGVPSPGSPPPARRRRGSPGGDWCPDDIDELQRSRLYANETIDYYDEDGEDASGSDDDYDDNDEQSMTRCLSEERRRAKQQHLDEEEDLEDEEDWDDDQSRTTGAETCTTHSDDRDRRRSSGPGFYCDFEGCNRWFSKVYRLEDYKRRHTGEVLFVLFVPFFPFFAPFFLPFFCLSFSPRHGALLGSNLQHQSFLFFFSHAFIFSLLPCPRLSL
jgi:hypothetical protein